MEPEVILSRHELNGRTYAELTLNRPAKGNALTMPMLMELSAHVSALARDNTVRAVVLRGRGRFFCTGGDIAAWGSLTPQQMADEWILRGIEVLSALAALPQPVIAVLTGSAFGGGLELAMAADLRIALADIKLCAPEVGIGMISGWGGVRRLAELIGAGRARHMMLLGEPITGEQALEWGLVTEIAGASEELEQKTARWVDRLCANGPKSMALTKGILASMHADMRHHHASAAAQAAGSDECREGVASFLEKRKPVFGDR